ncbi:hypothetical protein ACIRRH_36915 [Kitasatospora sp. NPDC101235]
MPRPVNPDRRREVVDAVIDQLTDRSRPRRGPGARSPPAARVSATIG